MSTGNDDIQQLYARIAQDGYDINKITSRELLSLLDNQVNNLLHISGNADTIDLNKLSVPSNKETETGVNLRLDNKLKHNFEDDRESERINNRRKIWIKRFYLKESPSLSTLQYLERIYKHCSLSTSVLLACSVYIFNVVLGIYYENQLLNMQGLKLLLLNKLNFYRLILTLIRVSLKFVEDKNYKIKHYCKIVGLNVKDYAPLELNFLFLIDFRFFVNQVVLVNNLKLMKRVDEFVKNSNK